VTKVLYVEDNDDNVFMLKMRLELLGDFEVLTAEDGEKGCQMAAAERPDIILMDLEMPVVDGWEATRRLKGNPQTRGIFEPLGIVCYFCKPPRLNAVRNGAESPGVVILTNPITGIACCARAASGHAAAAPPSSVMNSRRFIQSPRRREAGPNTRLPPARCSARCR
jgi:CheY-like chemotaxis protein